MMKKIALAVLLASGLMAAGEQDYIGISAGQATLDFRVKNDTGTIGKADFKETAYNFTLGHYYGEQGRVSATYTYIDIGDDMKHSDAITFSYDFIFPLGKMLALYAGPTIGYTRLEFDNGADVDGIHYGVQAGAIVRIVPKFEIEAGYRYLVENGSQTLATRRVELDSIGLWYIGANFRF